VIKGTVITMNTADYCFKVATRADKCGSWVFYPMLIASAVLAVWENPTTDKFCHPCLIVAAVLSILVTVITTIYQTEGNCALRATQLAHGFGSGIGEAIRADYYNNKLPHSIRKLAATTMENTLFTSEILSKMLIKMRIKVGVYFILLLVLFTCRETPTSWLVVFAQTLFSGDLVLKLIRQERFRIRTARVYKCLNDYFLLADGTEKPNDTAVVIGAFTDYECAKDEAALPLESEYFNKLNPELSRQWDEVKQRLKFE
jgi:hypothetical protein